MDLTTAKLDSLDFRLTEEQVRNTSTENQDAIRHACQTNLRFLINCVLRPPNSKKFPTLVERVHGPIIDSFLPTSPDRDLEAWSDLDEFVVLASRGMLKSTIGAAFLTQVILCSPDVRILVISGKLDKAESILALARAPFVSNAVIRFLFPEWQVGFETDNGKFISNTKVGTFICPKRDPELSLRDPTIEVASFDSVKAGGHYELIMFDDATNEINSNTVENCEKTHGQYDDTDPLVEPGGYRVFLGTKWNDLDLPAYIMSKSDQEFDKSGVKTASYFYQPAWKLKTDGTPREVEERNMREKTGALMPDDVILTWPEKLTARLLFKYYRKNRIDFYKQYLLDASLEQQHSFTDEILDKQIISRADFYKMVPHHDMAVVCYWDLASVFTGRRRKSETDYSCGIVVVFQKSTGRMFVVDMLLEHFVGGDDIANAVVDKYVEGDRLGPVYGQAMEDAAGARNLDDSFNRISRERGVAMTPIEWVSPELTANAKNVRIAVLASAMKNGFVFLLNDIPFFDDVKVQFEKWTVDAKRRKDDAPDCIARAWNTYKNQIHLITPSPLKSEGPVLSWEPEIIAEVEAPDIHADENENADVSWLSRFTVGGGIE